MGKKVLLLFLLLLSTVYSGRLFAQPSSGKNASKDTTQTKVLVAEGFHASPADLALGVPVSFGGCHLSDVSVFPDISDTSLVLNGGRQVVSEEIYGTLTSKEGKKIKHARVSVLQSDNRVLGSGSSNKHGLYRIKLSYVATWEYQIKVVAKHYATTTIHQVIFAANKPTILNITLNKDVNNIHMIENR